MDVLDSTQGADGPAGRVQPDDLVAALDVGGTSMKGALVRTDLRVVHQLRRATPRERGSEAVIEAMCDALAALAEAAGEPVAAAGVVVPGIVDERRGVAVLSTNLGWRNVPLAAVLAERLGRPVAFGHDVRAGAIAELALGAGQGKSDLLFLAIGTGVAGAFVVDGRPVVADGYAGEIGHLLVAPNGDPCTCGNRGCLETLASASALARRYSALSGVEVTEAVEVERRLRAGDPVARRVWDDAVSALATAIAASITLLAPEVVVVGGGLSQAGDLLLQPLREQVAQRLTFQRVPRIVPATLGDQAGCLGAALLALELAGRR